jgi:hypothetical protein
VLLRGSLSATKCARFSLSVRSVWDFPLAPVSALEPADSRSWLALDSVPHTEADGLGSVGYLCAVKTRQEDSFDRFLCVFVSSLVLVLF